MRRLVALAFSLLFVSCAAVVVPVGPSPDQPQTATEPPSAKPPVAGARLTSAQADFDCDGMGDRLEFFGRVAAAPGDANTIAQLVLATGVVHELMLVASVEGPPLIGATDVNGDGCDDAIVTLDRGASTIRATFLVYDRGELRVVEEDGRPATFLFGGSVRHGSAIECRRTKGIAEIVVRAVSDYTSDFQWDAVEDVHHWATRSELVLWSTTASVIPVSVRYAMPPDQDRYWALSCGSLKLGH
jgi:hypothetical protein